jgi:hypothetical protein
MSVHRCTPLVPMLLALFVAGCASSNRTPVKVEPILMSTSVDFTSPATIAGNSSPVYVLPVINSGWEKATVDSKTGAWKSGRYIATVVEEGYWTTQEEAERSGKPFMIMGKSGPLIGGNIREIGRSNTADPKEIETESIGNRVDKLEELNRLPARNAASDPDAPAQTAARMSALAGQTEPIESRGDVMVSSHRGGSNPHMQVPADMNRSVNSNRLDLQIPYSGSTKPVTYQLPVGNRMERITVQFIDSMTAMVKLNDGPSQKFHLDHPNDVLKININESRH